MGKAGKQSCLLSSMFCWIPRYLMRLVRLTHGVKCLENVIVHRASATGPSTTYLPTFPQHWPADVDEAYTQCRDAR